MTSLGKELRLNRLVRPATGRCILFAASHGTSTYEIFKPLEDTAGQIEAALSGGADCALVSVGFADASRDVLGRHPEKGWVAKVTATCYEDIPRETVTLTVESALRSGADAIGALMQVTPSTEKAVISMIAGFGEECSRLAVPFVVEAELPGAYDTSAWFPEDVVGYLRRSCRLAQELGADVVKTNWPGSAEKYADVISTVTRPTVVAGGSKVSDEELLKMISDAISAGAVGCSVGRNIFQSDDPRALTARIARVVHG